MASSNSINIWIKIDTTHRCAFHLPVTTTIKDLKQKILDKEGQEVDALMFRTKPIRNEDKNKKDLTLQDYGCYNECTFHASLRFLGGAEGCDATYFIDNKVQQLGATITTDNCKGGGGASLMGCKESNIKKAKMKCGKCIFCADCMRMTLDSLLNNGTLVYHCGYSECGKVKGAIDIDLAYAICAYDEKEMAKKDLQLDENALKSPFSMMKTCSKSECGKFITRNDNNKIRIQCGKCGTYTCWLCGNIHKNANTPLKCGNDECDPVANKQGDIDEGNMKNVHGKQCWNKRLCPGSRCWRVNAHKDNCNHMSCKCGFQYCHWCLQNWFGPHNANLCNVKGKQDVTIDMLTQ